MCCSRKEQRKAKSWALRLSTFWIWESSGLKLRCVWLNQSLLTIFWKMTQAVKCLPAMWETWIRSLGWEDKETATHSSTLAWKIPWTEEPGTLQTMGSQRVGYNWVTSLPFFLFFNPWIFLPNCSSKDQQNSLLSHYWSTKKKMLLRSLKIHGLSIPENC